MATYIQCRIIVLITCSTVSLFKFINKSRLISQWWWGEGEVHPHSFHMSEGICETNLNFYWHSTACLSCLHTNIRLLVHKVQFWTLNQIWWKKNKVFKWMKYFTKWANVSLVFGKDNESNSTVIWNTANCRIMDSWSATNNILNMME